MHGIFLHMACIYISHIFLLLLLAYEKTKLRRVRLVYLICIYNAYLWRVYDMHVSYYCWHVSRPKCVKFTSYICIAYMYIWYMYIIHITYVYTLHLYDIHVHFDGWHMSKFASYISMAYMYVWHIHIPCISQVYIHYTSMMYWYIIMADISEDESASSSPFI